MKTYENFITDIFKSKMTIKKFTKFLIKFINSILVNDKVKYYCTYAYAKLSSDLESHHIGAIYLEEYIIDIKEENEAKTVMTIKFSEFSLAFASLHRDGSVAIKKIKIIADELKNIQEFIKYKIEPIIKDKIDVIIRYKQTNRVKYVINVSDLEKVIPSINKEDYEIFLDQKKYNI